MPGKRCVGVRSSRPASRTADCRVLLADDRAGFGCRRLRHPWYRLHGWARRSCLTRGGHWWAAHEMKRQPIDDLTAVLWRAAASGAPDRRCTEKPSWHATGLLFRGLAGALSFGWRALLAL